MTNNCIHAVNGLCMDCSQYQKWIKELEAQVAGLVGALDEIANHSAGWGDKARKALSTLPSQYLEIAKAKDAVIQCAEYLVWPPKTESPSEVCPECGTYGYGELRDAFKTLRTLQQAEDKK